MWITFRLVIIASWITACSSQGIPEQGQSTSLESVTTAALGQGAELDHKWKALDKDYKSIHVFVALCDNKNQGIVPVPDHLGNGQDPASNLYWGAMYGVNSFFKRSREWEFVSHLPPPSTYILERSLFKHKKSKTYLLADAYDGAHILEANQEMILALAQAHLCQITLDSLNLAFGDQSDLIAYVGHNGLMDFDLDLTLQTDQQDPRDVMILACASSNYYASLIQEAGADPVLWTTSLMAPEAYVLHDAIASWIKGGNGTAIHEAAAKAYDHYQHCGINAARRLFKTGY